MNTTNHTTPKTEQQHDGIPPMFKRTEPSRPVAKEVPAKEAAPKADNTAKIAAAVEKSKARNAKKSAKQAAPKTEAKAKPAKVKAAPKAAPKAEQVDVGDGETVKTPPRSVVPGRFKQAYAAHNNTCGDKLGLVLKDYTAAVNADGRDTIDLAKLAEVAAANGIDTKRYDGLNNGMKRMNVSNKLRGMLKHGQKVTIGKQVFANAEKALTKEEVAIAA